MLYMYDMDEIMLDHYCPINDELSAINIPSPTLAARYQCVDSRLRVIEQPRLLITTEVKDTSSLTGLSVIDSKYNAFECWRVTNCSSSNEYILQFNPNEEKKLLSRAFIKIIETDALTSNPESQPLTFSKRILKLKRRPWYFCYCFYWDGE